MCRPKEKTIPQNWVEAITKHKTIELHVLIVFFFSFAAAVRASFVKLVYDFRTKPLGTVFVGHVSSRINAFLCGVGNVKAA